jgi:hypothetical protein
MNTKAVFAFLTLLIFSVSCHKDATSGNLNVSYEATYGGAHLNSDTNYDYGGFPIQFSRFDIFLSDVTLFNESKSVVLTESAYLLFTNDQSNVTLTPTSTYGNIPFGDYTGIKIGYGVKASNNGKLPTNFPSGSPLANGDEYWATWNSFIFSKIEGQADVNNDHTFETFLAYHCGSNAVYKYETITAPIHIASGSSLKIAFDLKKLLTQSDGSLYNISANPVTSNNVDSIRVALDIMQNFGKATSVSQ